MAKITNAKSIWNGTLSFGLVTIPVAIFAAAREYKSPFHQFRKRDLSPIRYKKVAEKDDIQVSQEEIVKGFEYAKNKVVAFTEEELEAIDIPSDKTIDIDCFVKDSEVDFRYFDKPYFLEAGKGGIKGYSLLYEALRSTGKIGVAKVALRNREYLVAVKANSDFKMLMLETLRFPEELLAPELTIAEKNLSKPELELAKQLVESRTTKFEPTKYKDNYREALEKLIETKLKGEKIVKKGRPTVTELHIPDMLEILRQSVKPKKEAKKKVLAA